MGTINSFEDILAWQKGMDLVRKVHKCTSAGEFSRDYALKDQIRRSSVSVVSNIAEGFERGGDKEFIQFLYIAKGSSAELRTQILIAKEFDYITLEACSQLLGLVKSTSELISGLIRYLKDSQHRGSKFK